jgi:hypothetical protein
MLLEALKRQRGGARRDAPDGHSIPLIMKKMKHLD